MKKKNTYFILLTGVIVLSGCSKNLYFGTSTSVGMDVSGTTKIPSKVSFSFNRAEVAIIPTNSDGNTHPVFASLDSEWTWFNGFMIKQIFATGKAADIASNKDKDTTTYTPTTKTSKKSLIFTTGTKLGIDIEFGQTTSTPASLLIGYRRSEMTLIPDVTSKKELDPVFADISIMSVESSSPDGVSNDYPQLGGVRIKQRFATGIAAINAARHPEIKNKLNKSVYGDPTLTAVINAKTRFDREGAIQDKYNSIQPPEQKAYLQTINSIFGRTTPNLITTSNLQIELGKLNDTQLEVASKQMQSL